MDGQWIGTFTGTNSGKLTIDIDRVGNFFICNANIFDNNNDLPNFQADFHISAELAKNGRFELKIKPTLIFDSNGSQVSDADAYVDTTWTVTSSRIEITWNNPNEKTYGNAECDLSNANQESKLETELLNWHEAKSRFFELERDRFIFRGQRDSKWRLQTGFHRRNRYNLSRFESFDIPLLHAETSAKTKHVFDLTKPLENAAFYAILQHHGYPTPLLDWTHSPFVAAFFAFRNIVSREQAGNARIFVFDAKSWREDFNQLPLVKALRPHFSLLKPLALENPRMAPQQSVFSVTNISDIESYLRDRSSEKSKKYISAIDIPSSQRSEALNDLSLIGISAASLFPGLDGICEFHAYRNFP